MSEEIMVRWLDGWMVGSDACMLFRHHSTPRFGRAQVKFDTPFWRAQGKFDTPFWRVQVVGLGGLPLTNRTEKLQLDPIHYKYCRSTTNRTESLQIDPKTTIEPNHYNSI